MHVILDRVRRTVRRHDLIPDGGLVLAAVSGGSDSVALAHLLHRLAGTEPFTLGGVAHLHHGLRDSSADEDARAVRALAETLGLPCYEEAVDVRARAATDGCSLEAAGRAARFDFFARAAGQAGADRVAVGHTADDQAETFLLRLLRGAGTRGLSSIYPRHGLVIRPLLDLSRHSLRDFLGAQKIAFRDDASNDDLSIPRNRVRHELLPYLRQRFSSGITGVLAREAELAREDADWLDAAANQVAGRVVVVQEDAVEIVPGGLEGVAAPLVRRIVRGALGTFADGRFIGFDHVEALLGMVRNREGDVLSLPGQRAVRAGDRIQLTPATADAPPPPVAFSYALPVPGAADVVEAGVVITAERGDAPDQGELSARAECVAIDAAGVAEPLTVRPRQAGDKIRPLGAPGRRLLQDVFVDRKIPRAVRARVPIVTDSQGHIVWVVGQTIAEEFRITGATQSVIILKARQLGGAG